MHELGFGAVWFQRWKCVRAIYGNWKLLWKYADTNA